MTTPPNHGPTLEDDFVLVDENAPAPPTILWKKKVGNTIVYGLHKPTRDWDGTALTGVAAIHGCTAAYVDGTYPLAGFPPLDLLNNPNSNHQVLAVTDAPSVPDVADVEIAFQVLALVGGKQGSTFWCNDAGTP